MSLPAKYYINDNGGSPMVEIIKLSILIPSIPERKEQLHYLHKKLRSNPFVRYACEILYDDSKRHDEGGLSVGYKRQALLDKAKGNYIWFLDDDDDFTPELFDQIDKAMEYGHDVISAKTLAYLDGTPHIIDTSITYDNEQIHDGETKRFPSVMNIYKREVALRVKFNDKNYGEDFEWSMALGLQTEVKINEVWHIYNFNSDKTVASK